MRILRALSVTKKAKKENMKTGHIKEEYEKLRLTESNRGPTGLNWRS